MSMNKNMRDERYTKANESLDIISSLEDNWNNNGASSFDNELLERCQCIINKLIKEPFVTPTACGSIQIEYEKENGDYLEFEMFNDKTEGFLHTALYGDKEFNICNMTNEDEINKIITEFYS